MGDENKSVFDDGVSDVGNIVESKVAPAASKTALPTESSDEVVNLETLETVTPPTAPPKKDETQKLPTSETEADVQQQKQAEEEAQEAAKTLQRDYSIFPEDWRGVIKKAPNKVFDFLKSKIPELLENSKKVEDLNKQINELQTKGGFVGHPDSWKLSPEYQQASATLQQANMEAAHWREQLRKCEAGEDVVMITGYDKDGNFVYDPQQYKATPEVKLYLQEIFQQALITRTKVQGDLANVQKTFKSSYDDHLKAVNAEAEKFFPWRKDASLLDKIDFGDGMTGKKARESFINMLPPSFKQSIPTDLGADMYLSNILRGKRILELENKLKAKELELKKLAKVSPIVKSSGGGTKIAPDDEVVNLSELPI